MKKLWRLCTKVQCWCSECWWINWAVMLAVVVGMWLWILFRG